MPVQTQTSSFAHSQIAEASPLGRVLAIMKSNVDELSPILSKAAYVAVTSPSDISRKGAVVVLLEPAEGVVCVSEDAKLLLKCCCSSDIDPTGSMGMGLLKSRGCKATKASPARCQNLHADAQPRVTFLPIRQPGSARSSRSA